MVAHRAGVAFNDAREAHVGARDQFDGGGGGIDLGHPAHYAAAKHDRGTHRDAEVFPFANHDALPPAGEITAGDPGVFQAIVVIGGEAKEVFETREAFLEFDVLLHRELVGRIEAGQIAAGGDQLRIGVKPQRPEFLQITGVGRRDRDGRREFEEARTGKGFHRHRDDEPRGDDKAERGKRAGGEKAAEGHG